MINDILNVAKKYTEGLAKVQTRREQWADKHKQLTEHLKEIADYLNKNANFEPGFFVDSFYAFDEQLNGTCVEMPAVTFRCGDIPMNMVFKNEEGNSVMYFEKGFQVTFNPTPTGQIAILLFPHHNNFHNTEPEYTPLLVVNDLQELSLNLVDEVIQKAMEAAFYSSFAGMAEYNRAAPQQNYTPIGFKKFDTTQKKTA